MHLVMCKKMCKFLYIIQIWIFFTIITEILNIDYNMYLELSFYANMFDSKYCESIIIYDYLQFHNHTKQHQGCMHSLYLLPIIKQDNLYIYTHTYISYVIFFTSYIFLFQYFTEKKYQLYCQVFIVKSKIFLCIVELQYFL